MAVQGCLWVLFGMNLDNPFNLFVDKHNPTHETRQTRIIKAHRVAGNANKHTDSPRAPNVPHGKNTTRQLARHWTAPQPSLTSTLVVVEPRPVPVPPCAVLDFDSAFPPQWQTRCQTFTMTLLSVSPIQRHTPCSLQQQWPSPGHSPSTRPSRTRPSPPSRLLTRVGLRTLLLSLRRFSILEEEYSFLTLSSLFYSRASVAINRLGFPRASSDRPRPGPRIRNTQPRGHDSESPL